MATFDNGHRTLLDAARAEAISDLDYELVKILAQSNTMAARGVWRPCNQGDTYVTVWESGLPESSSRMLNRGTPFSNGHTSQRKFGVGKFSTSTAVDIASPEFQVDNTGFIVRASDSHMRTLGNKFDSDLIYGSTAADPAGFDGLTTYFGSLDVFDGECVIDAGGQGSDNCSIWLIHWGPNGCFLTYPSSSSVGISMTSVTNTILTDENGLSYVGNAFFWELDAGFAFKDYRAVCRIANVDVSGLKAGAQTGSGYVGRADNLYTLTAEAAHRMKAWRGDLSMGAAWFVTPSTMFALEQQLYQSSNVRYAPGDQAKMGTAFSLHGLPVYTNVSLLETEARVS